MNIAISFIMFPIITVLFLAVPVAIGIFVYRDAAPRGMNAPLWTLVAVLAPSFIGLIIYLIVRAEHSSLTCPACAFRISEHFSVCPNCGHALKHRCKNCEMSLERGWKICPGCSEPITDAPYTTHIAHDAKKEKGMGKLLALIILVPLLLCGLLLVPIFIYRINVAEHSSGASLSAVESLDFRAFENKPHVIQWLEESDAHAKEAADQGIYILTYKTETADGKKTVFLVYRPDFVSTTETSISQTRSGFGSRETTLILNYMDFSNHSGALYHLMYIEYAGNNYASLEITLRDPAFWEGDSEPPYHLTTTDKDPSPHAWIKNNHHLDGASLSIKSDLTTPISALLVDYKAQNATVYNEVLDLKEGQPLDLQLKGSLFTQGEDRCVFTLLDMNGKAIFTDAIAIKQGCIASLTFTSDTNDDIVLLVIEKNES